MKVSLLLTCFNHYNFINDAFASLILNKHLIHEIIVCDDCSTDDSRILLEQNLSHFQNHNIVRIYNHTNLGLNQTLNLALKSISSDIIILQSCDDVSSEKRISDTIEFFAEHSSAHFLISSYQLIDDFGKRGHIIKRSGKYSDFSNLLRKGSSLPLYGMSFTRSFSERLYPMPVNISNDDDYIGFVATTFFGIHIHPSIHYFYRIHAKSMSNWTLSSDSTILRKNFYDQQTNRIDNFIAMRNKYLSSLDPSKNYTNLNKSILHMIDCRVSLHSFYLSLGSRSLITRLHTLIKCYRVLNFRDFILLVLGIAGVDLLSSAKRFIYGIKKV